MSVFARATPPISLYLELSIITVWRPFSVAPSLSYIRLCFLLNCQVQLQEAILNYKFSFRILSSKDSDVVR